jgi:hypothetical protein
MKVDELASSRAFTTRRAYPSPTNHLNILSGVMPVIDYWPLNTRSHWKQRGTLFYFKFAHF